MPTRSGCHAVLRGRLHAHCRASGLAEEQHECHRPAAGRYDDDAEAERRHQPRLRSGERLRRAASDGKRLTSDPRNNSHSRTRIIWPTATVARINVMTGAVEQRTDRRCARPDSTEHRRQQITANRKPQANRTESRGRRVKIKRRPSRPASASRLARNSRRLVDSVDDDESESDQSVQAAERQSADERPERAVPRACLWHCSGAPSRAPLPQETRGPASRACPDTGHKRHQRVSLVPSVSHLRSGATRITSTALVPS